MGLTRTQLQGLPGAAEWPLPPEQEDAIPMQTHAWMRARADAIHAPHARYFPAVRDGNRIVALAPLLRDSGWLRELPALFEPADLVWHTREALEALTAQIASQPLPLFLERLPADSPTLPLLRKAYGARGLVRTRPAMPTPVIILSPDCPDYDACLSAGRRSDFRRMARRAQPFGEAEYEIHEPVTDTELTALLDLAYGVDARSWKQAAGTALTADAWQGAFFRRFAAAALYTRTLRFAFLRLGGQVAAMQIALEWRQRFWLLKMSFDQAFASCSPGQLLMLHTLRHAARKGLLSYEFMGVMDDWTALWTRETRRYLQVRATPLNLATGKRLLKQGVRSLLTGVRRPLS